MVSPGPDFILVTRSALLGSRRNAMFTAAGIVAGCAVHASYCALGLALIITQNLLVFSTIRYLGAAYLIYIGARALFSKPGSTSAAPVAGARSAGGAFVQGFLCNLLNPKLALFLLSLFTQFVSIEASTTEKALVSMVFLAEAVIYWPLLVLLLQSSAIRAVFQDLHRVVDRICGALLLGLGVKIALQER